MIFFNIFYLRLWKSITGRSQQNARTEKWSPQIFNTFSSIHSIVHFSFFFFTYTFIYLIHSFLYFIYSLISVTYLFFLSFIRLFVSICLSLQSLIDLFIYKLFFQLNSQFINWLIYKVIYLFILLFPKKHSFGNFSFCLLCSFIALELN